MTDQPTQRMRPASLPFTIDSHLLRELGERLIGHPHVALAELIKNSYDADATEVEIRIEQNRIVVTDNGHGMSFEEFKDFWMRIGTTHKDQKTHSRFFKRPLTGSKGIGRLSSQFLGDRLRLQTTARSAQKNTVAETITASVRWSEAVNKGDLTQACVNLAWGEPRIDYLGSDWGTKVEIQDLKSDWKDDKVQRLAQEIWFLQPPRVSPADEERFRIKLKGVDEQTREIFGKQMKAILDIWHAKIDGRLVWEGNEAFLHLKVNFAGENRPYHYKFPAKDIFRDKANDKPCLISSLDYRIRVYHLIHRQPHGLSVGEARTYVEQFGGVNIYDARFRLPHYGRADADWLEIERDHSHRKIQSALLPKELADEFRGKGGLSFLPTASRLIGWVNVDTNAEKAWATKHGFETIDILSINPSRDRLQSNAAYNQVRELTRLGLDLYAILESRRQFREKESQIGSRLPVSSLAHGIDRLLITHASAIPKEVLVSLRSEAGNLIRASEQQEERSVRQIGLLGALATAGMGALALHHEVQRSLLRLKSIIDSLEKSRDPEVRKAAGDLGEFAKRLETMRSLFSPLLDEESRVTRERLRAKEVLERVEIQLGQLLRGTPLETNGVPDYVRLPPGYLPEWSAIFQNVLTNAVNAMLDSHIKRLQASYERAKGEHRLSIQDTGVGVDLENTETLFEPFERRLELSAYSRPLLVGGAGIGLTIVRMIAEKLKCRVGFEKPDKSFNTRFVLSWSEQ